MNIDRSIEKLQSWLDGNYVSPQTFKDSIEIVIKTIKEQQQELEGWRNEFQGI